MGIKSYEVIGYTYNASAFCPDCINETDKHNEEAHPIFASDEWDYEPSCDVCKELIPVCVTIRKVE